MNILGGEVSGANDEKEREVMGASFSCFSMFS